MMAKLIEKFGFYAQLYNALIPRQRAVIFLAAVSLVYVVWYIFLGQPIDKSINILVLENDYLESQYFNEEQLSNNNSNTELVSQ